MGGQGIQTGIANAKKSQTNLDPELQKRLGGGGNVGLNAPDPTHMGTGGLAFSGKDVSDWWNENSGYGSGGSGGTGPAITPVSPTDIHTENSGFNPRMGTGGLGSWDIAGNGLDAKLKQYNPIEKVKAYADQTVHDPGVQQQMANGVPDPNGGGANGSDWLGPYPDYSTILDPTGKLRPQYTAAGGAKVTTSPVQAYGVDRSALNALTARGLAQGPSPWLNMMNDRTGAMQAGYADDAVRAAGQSRLGAMDAAAMRGGLSGGAAARMAGRAQDQQSMGLQAASKWGADAQLQNGLEDERTKVNILSQIPGMELANAKYYNDNDTANADRALKGDVFNSGMQWDANRFNTGNAVADVANRNPFNVGMNTQDVNARVGAQNAGAISANADNRPWWQRMFG